MKKEKVWANWLTNRRKENVICRADKDGKIVILNYEGYDAIMTRELQPFQKLDVSVEDATLTLKNWEKIATTLWSKSTIWVQ